jgi:hypothetical protein
MLLRNYNAHMKMIVMRAFFLWLVLALVSSTAPLGTSALRAESCTQDLTCEICRKTNKDGTPCKAKVTRGSTTPAGINYSCSAGHNFTVEPKVKIR